MNGFNKGLLCGALVLACGQWFGVYMTQPTPATVQQAERLPADPMPRLIGVGCHGAGGDLWAMEESDFPTQCKVIEVYQP